MTQWVREIVKIKPASLSMKIGHGTLKKGESVRNANKITKENAADMARRRWEVARERAALGMQKAVESRLANGQSLGVPTDAWEHIIKHATNVYLESRSPKGLSNLGTFLGSSTGMLKGRDESAGESELPLAGLEDARNIIQIFNFYNTDYQKEKADVIDAEVL